MLSLKLSPVSSRPSVTKAVHANRGIEIAYQRRLETLIGEMQNSALYWIKAQYRDAPPVLAKDATPSQAMIAALRKLAKRWQRKFDEAAPKIAEAYLKGAFKATDSAMRVALKDVGFAVKFEMTPAMKDALAAKLNENVGLIKSIPAEYLQSIEGSVMRSYSVGGDLQKLVSDIKEQHPVTLNKAVLIARDQNNKANAVVTRTRQLELGIDEAIWMHSHGGKTPRPLHVAADGKRYKVAEGCLIGGKYIFPGEEINCRCVSRSVVPGF